MNNRILMLTSVGLVLLSGCAGSGLKLEKSLAFEAEQNWQAKAIEVPADLKDLRSLSVAVIGIDPLWMGDAVGYLGEGGEFVTRDAWRMFIFRASGIVESSAIINNRLTTLYGMMPNIPVDEARRLQVLIVSGSGSSVMTARAEIIGPLSMDPVKREAVKVEQLISDVKYRGEFFAKHPSTPEQVGDFSPGTTAGDKFVGYISQRFPALSNLGGGKYRSSDQTGVAAREINRATLIGKLVESGSFKIGVHSFNPMGGAMTAVGFLMASYQAARTPLHGSFAEAQFSGLEIAKTIKSWIVTNNREISALQKAVLECQRDDSFGSAGLE